ncbi:unnamed protein product [Paramecium sonneborni]|uniref:Uncharacterized protein n=1 Tax=Paramecium sonneborni TaxID=65129 RepID=A0A8S1MHN7_9CILI|nr:unnamed protein product [Paramecium sonneborni]
MPTLLYILAYMSKFRYKQHKLLSKIQNGFNLLNNYQKLLTLQKEQQLYKSLLICYRYITLYLQQNNRSNL